ncbi:hypothetical protein BS78_K017500 [Paspalum vaginatum]|uniref:RWP-RK domain-containing protein n=1 Tax=Paspalum vaginatum TaxID=158149 RepID=A0A9W7XF13_9POAL|nr:hypothetical protein BS78_K017500 [Paspalum vaginatum]
MAYDGHGEGADWQGSYDRFLLSDDFDEALYLLDMDGEMDQPSPAAAQEQDVTARPSGDNLPEWPAMLDESVKGSAPTHNAFASDPLSGAQGVVTGTSATASASSSAAHQNALDCTGCEVLREVLHSDGLEATKLSIHGAAGVFYHAIMEAYRIDSGGQATALGSHSYIDFEGQDYVWVKHYLTDYAQQRAASGNIVLQDSISAFQDALCTSMACGGSHANYHHKRERAGKLQLQDIARYFHLPIVEAAKALRVCATVLKGTSRKFRVQRWPYRKIKCIDNQIARLRRKGNTDAEAMREIERLTHSRRMIYEGLE